MSASLGDTRSRSVATLADRLPAVISGAGLAGITAGTALIEGWLPVGVALGTAIVWWRTTTPLALAAVTIGLTAAIPRVTPAIQSGVSVTALANLGVAVVLIAVGMGLLTIGSWLASGTTPPLAGGWTLLPLGVGWLCVGGAAVAGVALWVVLAVCGGLTLFSANAITQLTDHQLMTAGDEADRRDYRDQ